MFFIHGCSLIADNFNKGRKGGYKGETHCYRIIKMVMERNFAPVIVFSFSKKDCEAYALQMAKLDFNTKVAQLVDGAGFPLTQFEL